MDMEYTYTIDHGVIKLVSLLRRPSDDDMLMVERLAEWYLRRLHAILNHPEWQNVARQHCYVDDVCDSNMVMHQAFLDAGLEVMVADEVLFSDEGMSQEACDLWNGACMIAQTAMFTHEFFVKAVDIVD